MSKLSILCATYNNSEHQLRCLIHSILGQSFKDLTLYILADGKQEIAEGICRSIDDPRLRYKEYEHQGKFGFPIRNKVLFELSSKYVAFQSGDNYVTPKAYEYLITAAESNDLDVVFCPILHNYPNISSYNRDGTQDKSRMDNVPYTVLDKGFGINQTDLTNFIVKTKIAQQVGGFNTSLPDHLIQGADGFFCETLMQKVKNIKIAKIKPCLFCHN